MANPIKKHSRKCQKQDGLDWCICEEHTPTLLDRLHGMTPNGILSPLYLANVLESKNVGKDTKDYIVKAVNCHEELLKIAKAYRNSLRNSTSTGSFMFAEKIIAKAEGVANASMLRSKE